jgi:hypothetical protein
MRQVASGRSMDVSPTFVSILSLSLGEIILPVFTHLGEEDGIDLGTVLEPG